MVSGLGLALCMSRGIPYPSTGEVSVESHMDRRNVHRTIVLILSVCFCVKLERWSR
jgi:hypothetical protein